jgi:hypothetical protein
MNENVTFFRGNAVVPAHQDAWAKNFKSGKVISLRSFRRSAMPSRAVLVAVWRTNPASGRPECRWTTARSAAVDEGASLGNLLRRAA